MSEVLVREVLRRRLAPLAALLARQQPSVNPFLDAIGPDVAASSSLTRALTSQMGGWLARVARDLATSRFGDDAVPPLVYSDTVTNRTGGPTALGNDTVVVTRLDEAATRDAAVRLLRSAVARPVDVRIGTDGFRRSFGQAVADLRRLPLATRAWSVQVDLFVRDPSVGFAELESGGNLDTSNVKGQTEKLVRAGLAYGDGEAPLHFCLAYANRGEGVRPQGGLPTYLAPAGAALPSSGLLIGSAWWTRVLPADVSHARFLELFGEVVREMQGPALGVGG